MTTDDDNDVTMDEEFGDGGEADCDGDPTLDEIDWDEVQKLELLQQEALAVPEEDRPMAMLGLLAEMYGDDLEVL